MKAELIDSMGSDLTVVNAARVSFDKESDWEWEEILDYVECDVPKGSLSRVGLFERDQKLIKYLATHGHWTPFSHVMITMRETVPIFVARQRFKHMVGFTYNEVSRRYVDDNPAFFIPSSWRMKAENKKQGSSEGFIDLESEPFVKQEYENALAKCEDVYNFMLRVGVAPEQARMVLPQSMYTSYYVTGSLAAWARAYKLRIDEHSQKEIQDLAKQWNEIITNIPELKHSWKALTTKEE